MHDAKWKFLILSIIAYQGLLTWCLFDLVDTAAYLARTECGERCAEQLFGFILTNQGGRDTAMLFTTLGGLLVFANLAVWTVSAARRRREKGASA